MEKEKKLSAKKEAKIYKRHKRIWWLARHFAAPFILPKFNCKSEVVKNLPEPYLVLSNHVCDLDPALVGMSFPKQMYFVASEHVYRRGFISKILLYTFGPIAKIKGASDKMMVLKVVKSLREKKNICIFPEGNRSFNGRNMEITSACGKLVKVSGANLVTYKLTGGFFTNPRWGYGLRKGKMTGNVVRVYTKEELANMTPEEITEAIRNDIKENAYERQAIENIRFKGKDLAVGMECAYTVCPVCSKIGNIGTEKNSVFCKECGPLADYNEYGYFENNSNGFTFKTIEQWDDWQEEFYKKFVEENAADSDKPFFCDEDVVLRTVNQDHEEGDLGKGKIWLTSKGLYFKSETTDMEITIKALPDMGMYGKKGLVFTDEKNVHYELHSEALINVRKYISVWKILKEKLQVTSL